VFGRFVPGDMAVPVVGAANATAVAGGFELRDPVWTVGDRPPAGPHVIT
jgi:hypothetical protein